MSDDEQPILLRVGRRISESGALATFHGSRRTIGEGAAGAGVEPFHTELALGGGEAEVGGAAIREIDEVKRACFCEAELRIVVLRIPNERIGVLHFREGDFFVAEKIERDAAVVPAFVAAAEVFADEVVLRELVAEVVFHARAARAMSVPQRQSLRTSCIV